VALRARLRLIEPHTAVLAAQDATRPLVLVLLVGGVLV
jgi:hypothetical protein